MSKTFCGRRDEDGNFLVRVLHNGREKKLRLRLDLFNHSPTGFAWGYAGSGPAQLALAILADVLGDDERAVRLHQPFKRAKIAGLPFDGEWEIGERDVLEWVSRHGERTDA